MGALFVSLVLLYSVPRVFRVYPPYSLLGSVNLTGSSYTTMAPAFSMLRSSSRRRDKHEDEPVLDALYGDAAISAPNGSLSSQCNDSRAPSQPSPPITEAPVKTSITITISLPWRSKSRSHSLPPSIDRWKPDPVGPAEPAPPHELQPAIESRPPSRSKMASPPTTVSPNLVSQTQGSSRKSPRPQHLSSAPQRPTPSSTPVLGILSPVAEGIDDEVRHQVYVDPTTKTSSPPPPEVLLDSSNTPFEGRYRQTRSVRSRSPGPEYTRRSPPLLYPSRRARSVDPEMHRRRSSESSDSSTIDSDCDSLEESSRGSFSSRPRADSNKAVKGKGFYDIVADDYSHIIRDLEAEYQAARRLKERAKTKSAGSAGSAGSGISADSGYGSGPQELVPSGEDLWG